MALCLSSMGSMACNKNTKFNAPSASLSFLTGSRTTSSVSLNIKSNASISLHCSFTPTSSLSFSSASSFAGSSLGLELSSGTGTGTDKRRRLVVRAGKKYALCQTKRNRSRKSLARTHGFRKRMSTTSGRATIKRRRAKGRWKLCTKTNPNSGKRA